jgi:hypothetical protein
MSLYLAVLTDKHTDDFYSLHASLDGANEAIQDWMEEYPRETWKEEDYGQPTWVRYVHSDCGDGPRMLIEVVELNP